MGPQPDLDRGSRRQLLPIVPRARQAGARTAKGREVVGGPLQRRLGQPDTHGFLFWKGIEADGVAWLTSQTPSQPAGLPLAWRRDTGPGEQPASTALPSTLFGSSWRLRWA